MTDTYYTVKMAASAAIGAVSSVTSFAELTTLIANTQAFVEGATKAIFYSGSLTINGQLIPMWEVANQFTNANPDWIRLGQTPVGSLIESIEFQEKVRALHIANGLSGPALESAVLSTTDSSWRQASGAYADRAIVQADQVRTFVGNNPGESWIFEESPRLLGENARGTTPIDGIQTDYLREQVSTRGLEYVRESMAEVSKGAVLDAVSRYGSGPGAFDQIDTTRNSQSVFEEVNKLRDRIGTAAAQEIFTKLGEINSTQKYLSLTQNALPGQTQSWTFQEKVSFGKGLAVIQKGGSFLLALDLINTMASVRTLYNDGNSQGAGLEITSFIGRFGGGIVGGHFALAAIGLLGLGPAMGLLMIAGLGLAGVALGGFIMRGLGKAISGAAAALGLSDPIADLGSFFGGLMQMISPVVLDLDGDGLELTSLDGSLTLFDLDADGFAQHTGWVGPDDGLLVRDLNQNGTIDDITELFGSATTSGYAFLRDLDANADDVLNASDPAFGELRVWRDLNQDGQSTPDELKTLSELGIASFNLNATEVQETIAGNEVRERSTYTLSDSTTRQLADVWFATNPALTLDIRPFTPDPAAALLPNLRGYGSVSYLFAAMSRDSTLRDMVRDVVYASSTDLAAWGDDKIAAILYRWAGVQDVDPTSRGVYVDARQLEFMEALLNREFVQVGVGPDPRWNAGAGLNDAWQQIFAHFKSRLLTAGPLSEIFPEVFYDIGTDQIYGLDLDAAIQLATEHAPSTASERTLYWHSVISVFDSLESSTPLVDYEDLLAAAVSTSGESATLSELRTPGTTSIVGTSSGETLFGSPGQNLIDGGGGNDTLVGGGGNDAYQFGRGYGQDLVIEDSGASWDDTADVIEFASGVAPGDVHVARSTPTSNDLVFTIDGTSDKLTVKDWAIAFDAGQNKRIEEIRFFDSTLWTRPQINQMAIDAAKTGGDDLILGFETADRLDGGAGNDRLEGSGGNDTYVFGLGYDYDSISDIPPSGLYDDVDTVEFGAGIEVDDLVLSRAGNALVIDIAGTTDRLAIEGQLFYSTLNGAYFRIENFKFADETVWGALALTMRSSAGDDYMAGDPWENEFDGGAGDDHMEGMSGADTYHFGLGYGTDTIFDVDGSLYSGGTDRVVLGAGITTSNIHLAMGGATHKDLVITVDGYADQLIVKDHFYAGFYALEELKFADDTVWTRADISLLIGGGTPGDDTIYGDDFVNRLDGGAGTDRLEGKGGADIYVFGHGYGQDTAYDNPLSGAMVPDAVEFANDIAPGDVTYTRQGDHLLIGLAGATDTLKIEYQFFATTINEIEEFRFGNGTVVTAAQVRASIVAAQATSGNDLIQGFVQADILDGGAGVDRLEGGAGGDTYRFGLGYGYDTIYDYRNTSNDDPDVVELGAGIATTDLTLYQGGPNNQSLVIKVNGTTDGFVIEGYFNSNNYYKIEEIRFADSTVWDAAAIQSHLGSAPYGATIAGTFASETLTDTTGADVFFGDLGNDIQTASTGNDTFVYRRGDGNDIVDENSVSITEVDTLKLVDLNAADITVSRVGTDVIITDNVTGHTIENDGFFSSTSSNYGFDQIEFADATIWDRTRIIAEAWTRGTAGADSMTGTAFNDTFFGDTGSDTIYSTSGSDLFIYRSGDGSDVVDEDSGSTSETDVLRFLNINPAGVILTHVGNDLMIKIIATGEVIEVDGQFASTTSSYGIERLEFADGTVWDRARLLQEAWIAGTTGADTLSGSSADDTFFGDLGNDTFNSTTGSDRFIYRSGDGTDFINEGSLSTNEIDTLKLTDLNPEHVTLSRVGNDLMIRDNTTGQTIEDDEHFLSMPYNIGLDQIEFANGTVWDRARMNQEAWFRGTTGADSFSSTDWNDTYFGDLGNDSFSSTVGSDTFIYRRGDGSDFINEENNSSTYVDVLRLVDLNASDVTLAHTSSTDLMVRINATGETIEVDEQFWSPTGYWGIERLEFADTTFLNRTDIDNAAGTWQVGTSSANTQTGAAKSDILMGNGGNDTLSGLGAADLLEGGDGDDTLTGGIGDDYLVGGSGDDTYTFAVGDGVDRIDNRDASSTNDRLTFGSGIDHDELWLQRAGDDLLISVMGSSADKVRVQGWFGQTSGQTLDKLVAGDNWALGESQVQQLVDAMASFTGEGGDPAVTYNNNLPSTVQTAIAAAWQQPA